LSSFVNKLEQIYFDFIGSKLSSSQTKVFPYWFPTARNYKKDILYRGSAAVKYTEKQHQNHCFEVQRCNTGTRICNFTN